MRAVVAKHIRQEVAIQHMGKRGTPSYSAIQERRDYRRAKRDYKAKR